MKNSLLRNWPFLIFLLSFTLIVWPLFLPGYFFHHDDLQVMRVFEMRRCYDDLQIPCRWVPDMGYGNGFPLFNYYSALPYYIGGVFTYFTTYINSAKMLFLLPILFGGLGVYLLVGELFDPIAAVTASILFSFAPYRALDIYVRGAIAESWGLSVFPYVLFFSYRLIKKQTLGNYLGTAISLGAFLICHNIMTMFFSPLIALWVAFWLFFLKPKKIWKIISGLVNGVGLSAFFLFPAFLEKNLVHIDTLTQGGSDFHGHFVDWYQLFFQRYWGYGASVFGPNDTLSFQIGWPQWWIVVLVLLLLITVSFKMELKGLGKVSENNFFLGILFIAVFCAASFMMHQKSVWIWDHIRILHFAQFPWRLLSVTIICCAVLGGLLIAPIQGRAKVILSLVIVILAILLNWSYFRPKDFYTWMDDHYKLTGAQWDIQQKSGLLDYLPATAKDPAAAAPDHPEITKGKVNYSDFQNRSNRFSINAQVIEVGTLEFPVFDFPNWQVYVDNKLVPHQHNNYLGRISITLPPGTYRIEGKLANTPVRTASNMITLISICGLIIYAIYEKKHFAFR